MSAYTALLSTHKQAFRLSFPNGWTLEYEYLTPHENHEPRLHAPHCQGVLLVSIPLVTLFDKNNEAHEAFICPSSGKMAQVALADWAARRLSGMLPRRWHFDDSLSRDSNLQNNHLESADDIRVNDSYSLELQTMGQARRRRQKSLAQPIQRQRLRRAHGRKREAEIPFVLERTDCMVIPVCSPHQGHTLIFFLHFDVQFLDKNKKEKDDSKRINYIIESIHSDELLRHAFAQSLPNLFHQLQPQLSNQGCFSHVAAVVLQCRLRNLLQPTHGVDMSEEENKKTQQLRASNDTVSSLEAVAFIADGSLLPRKSGRSQLPMPSPPAIPFFSPDMSEQLTRIVTVEVGTFWRQFLTDDGRVVTDLYCKEQCKTVVSESATTVSMRGMIIPRGVTLIVGGGYHGKSTLLQALAVGVYNKIPGDGRERCVTHANAVSVRAEDGRYVQRCNVSAFISNLPGSGNGSSRLGMQRGLDTTQFSTKDASGSTSQAANVIEALESGASTLLVDEDVSAANFMARDGRMRAMIMDEPITPLLYRVNGLFLSKKHQISTVVVVGGVGEWLDVADAVVLMKDYVAYDGLKKARSVSYQFSYGHVQYAGRGVVHRLPWEVKEENQVSTGVGENDRIDQLEEKIMRTLSPLRRRPDIDCIERKFRDASVHLLESGSSRLWFYSDSDEYRSSVDNNENDNDEDDGIVDMSKCSQLEGHGSEQLYGCGVCTLSLLRNSMLHPQLDIKELLQRLESYLDSNYGITGLLLSLSKDLELSDSTTTSDILQRLFSSHAAHDLWDDVGFAYRPRVHEVAMTLMRLRGLAFELLPEKPTLVGSSSKEEEEKKKMAALAELWSNRRKK